MKDLIMHYFKTLTPFKEKFSDHFKDLHKLKLLTNIDVSLTSSPGRVTNSKFDTATILYLTSEYYSSSVLSEKFYFLEIGPVHQKL